MTEEIIECDPTDEAAQLRLEKATAQAEAAEERKARELLEQQLEQARKVLGVVLLKGCSYGCVGTCSREDAKAARD